MTIQECYRQMGANYEDVLKRLYNEGMICRFTLMFLNDDSYPKLEQALKEGNVKEAFRAAHTLKGVCQNLGFTNLYQLQQSDSLYPDILPKMLPSYL